jgi:predicted RNA-binding Zn-ribbon protein involved in translation (DUF1610 family)
MMSDTDPSDIEEVDPAHMDDIVPPTKTSSSIHCPDCGQYTSVRGCECGWRP